VLDEAGIAGADGLAAVTGNDDLNTVVARLARQQNQVPKVVARLFDPHKSERYQRLGITTVATTNWGIARVTENLLFPDLRVIASLGTNQIELVELEIPPALAGRALADLASPQEVQAVAVQRRGRTFLATQEMPLEAADTLYIAIVAGAVDHLNSQLGIL
jgi:trk system potassium uptake protein TrkA